MNTALRPSQPDGQARMLSVWGSRRRTPAAMFDTVAAFTSYRRGEEIYRRSDPTDHWYRLVSGVAKKYTVTADGRQQIVEFLLPDDFFGFGAGRAHQFIVEAVAGRTVVACYPRDKMEALITRDPGAARLLREVAFEQIARSQLRLLALVRMGAQQRVGAFLIEMSERLCKEPAEPLLLPMSRYEIADYVGLSVEAVSRALTSLKYAGIIRLSGTRSINIVDRDTLEGLDPTAECICDGRAAPPLHQQWQHGEAVSRHPDRCAAPAAVPGRRNPRRN